MNIIIFLFFLFFASSSESYCLEKVTNFCNYGYYSSSFSNETTKDLYGRDVIRKKEKKINICVPAKGYVVQKVTDLFDLIDDEQKETYNESMLAANEYQKLQIKNKIQEKTRYIFATYDMFIISKEINGKKYNSTIDKLFTGARIEFLIKCNKKNKICEEDSHLGVIAKYKNPDVESDINSKVAIKFYNYTYSDFISVKNCNDINLFYGETSDNIINIDDVKLLRQTLPDLYVEMTTEENPSNIVKGYDNIENYFKNVLPGTISDSPQNDIIK